MYIIFRQEPARQNQSSKKILYDLLMTQISKKDYTDDLDCSTKFVPEGNIREGELAESLIEGAPYSENILSRQMGINHRCLEILMT